MNRQIDKRQINRQIDKLILIDRDRVIERQGYQKIYGDIKRQINRQVLDRQINRQKD